MVVLYSHPIKIVLDFAFNKKPVRPGGHLLRCKFILREQRAFAVNGYTKTI